MLTCGVIQIVITLRSKVVETAFRVMDSTDRVTLRSGLEIQVLPSLRDIKLAQRHQCAAFIHDESYILVWDDSPTKLLERAADLEHQLVDIAWFTATGCDLKPPSTHNSDTGSLLELGYVVDRRPTYINSVICACTLALSLLVVGLGMKVLAHESTLDHTYARLAAIAFTPIQFLLALVCHRFSVLFRLLRFH